MFLSQLRLEAWDSASPTEHASTTVTISVSRNENTPRFSQSLYSIQADTDTAWREWQLGHVVATVEASDEDGVSAHVPNRVQISWLKYTDRVQMSWLNNADRVQMSWLKYADRVQMSWLNNADKVHVCLKSGSVICIILSGRLGILLGKCTCILEVQVYCQSTHILNKCKCTGWSSSVYPRCNAH